MHCPRCDERLATERAAGVSGLVHPCPAGHGQAVGTGPLRRAVGELAVGLMWQHARTYPQDGPACSSCRRAASPVALRVEDVAVEVDVCTSCHVVWLDDGEYASVFDAAQVADTVAVREDADDARDAQDSLPPEAREALALARVRLQADRAARERAPSPPHLALTLLGMPVEHNPHARPGVPLVTLGLVAVLVVVWLATWLGDLSGALETAGLVPREAARFGGLTFLTYAFVHAGIAHLAGNAAFLAVLGDDVERHLGAGRYVGLLAAGTAVGGLTHVLVEPASNVPLVGASAGISAVLAFYVLRFPRARIGFIAFYRWLWVPVPVWGVLWLAAQVAVYAQQLRGTSSVSAAAHLGGVLVGLVLWLVWREE